MIRDTYPGFIENIDPEISSSDSKIIEGIIVDLRTVIDELHMNCDNAKNLVLELARRFDETKRYEQSQICRKIKEILQDKIKDGKITEKWIEACLPPEYKRKYAKSEFSSLSKKAKGNAARQHQKNKDIIATPAQIPKSALTAVDGHNNDGRDDGNLYNDNPIKQGPNKQVANQHTTFEDYDDYKELCSENYELKQALRKQTCILKADQISATELALTIHKTKYEDVKAAMESSRDSICVTFDRSGVLQRAEPDVLREK